MGIDYGRGMTNIDTTNGIRFGVLPMHEVAQAWCDNSEPQYGSPDISDCDCPECGHNDGEQHSWGDDLQCEECSHDWGLEFPDCAEPLSHTIDDGEYTASQSNDDSDIFITKSPYYTICGFCSPCAPGAGYLLTRSDDCKAYCFGHDFFDDCKAPYPVYNVADDSLVLPDDIKTCSDANDYFESVEVEGFDDFLTGYLLGLAFTGRRETSEEGDDTPLFGEPGCDIADCVDVESDLWDKFTTDQQNEVVADCLGFFASAYPMIVGDFNRAGSDFHLTRNGHGAGFWDGDWTNGDELTELAKPYGSRELYCFGVYIDDLEEDGFEGPDASLETSFFEYGLIWKVGHEKADDNQTLFYYGADYVGDPCQPTRYHWADFDNDLDCKSEFNWVEWSEFLSSLGMEYDDWCELPLGQRIFDLVNHYGSENIFGASYYEGTPIYCDDTQTFDFVS